MEENEKQKEQKTPKNNLAMPYEYTIATTPTYLTTSIGQFHLSQFSSYQVREYCEKFKDELLRKHKKMLEAKEK